MQNRINLLKRLGWEERDSSDDEQVLLDALNGERVNTWEFINKVKIPLMFPWTVTTFFTLCYQIPLWHSANHTYSNKTLDNIEHLHWVSFWFYALSLGVTAWILHPIIRRPSAESCGIAFQNIFTRLDCRRSGTSNEELDESRDVEMANFKQALDKAFISDESSLMDNDSGIYTRFGYGTSGSQG
jgi:hypothetical protein